MRVSGQLNQILRVGGLEEPGQRVDSDSLKRTNRREEDADCLLVVPNNVKRPFSFGFRPQLESYRVPLLQNRAETGLFDIVLVEKDLFTSLSHDETVSPRHIEEFHFPSFHELLLSKSVNIPKKKASAGLPRLPQCLILPTPS
jgi:hypothetical protein